jgi:V/A-type H+-transporting ATPase subunit B
MNSAVNSTHKRFASQLYASYANAKKIESFASIIGESELSDLEKKYLKFSKEFDNTFINQDLPRSMNETFEVAKKLLKILPKSEMTRLSQKELGEIYDKE